MWSSKDKALITCFLLRRILVVSLAFAQQEPVSAPSPSTDQPTYKFGITVVSSEGLRGDIYLLKPGTHKLPDFRRLKSIGSIYTPVLNIPPRSFTDGFPGVTDRFEWFAIDYNGKFWVTTPGRYRFALESDDGSKLYIDGKIVINNDGIHAPLLTTGNVKLKIGMHSVRISYFQGPRDQVALRLRIAVPGEDGFRIFNTDHLRPLLRDADVPQELSPTRAEDTHLSQ